MTPTGSHQICIYSVINDCPVFVMLSGVTVDRPSVCVCVCLCLMVT